MTRDEIFAALKAKTTHERGQAARALAAVAIGKDLPRIRRALQRETVAYVRTALQDVIESLTRKGVALAEDVGDDAEVSKEARQQIYGEAVAWVTGFLLHEISTPIGLATLAASREIGEKWEGSRTQRHLENVKRIFGAIEVLKDAAGVPHPQEFDLAALLQEIVSSELPTAERLISLIGPKPFLIKSDPALVQLAVANGIRNAVEAVALAAEDAEPQHPIIINWEGTDRDYWVSVLDKGIGIVGPIESAFEAGKSTKTDHSGFGLAIARQAIETLGGNVSLQVASGGGAIYEARWKR
ncbi:MAG: hypothetical protein JWR80_538 [Bradyrhizobium sp.]|nr:hypothetical protein [Bradyrhizobium sp.]